MSKGETTMYRMVSSWKIGLILFTSLVISVLPVQGTIAPTGEVSPIYDGHSQPWDVTTLIVGDASNGTLLISTPNEVTVDANALVAKPTADTGGNVVGTLTVTGAGSTLTIDQQLIIGAMTEMDPNGWSASGTLNILTGGLVDVTQDVILAYDANTADVYNSSATVTVFGPDSNLVVGGDLYASHGDDSISTMSIVLGGAVNVSSSDVYLGYGADSISTMTVDAVSSLNYDGMLYLGFGEGALGSLSIDLSNLGSAKTMNAILANDVNSVGILSISDANNQDVTLDSGGSFIVGNGEGSTGTFTITNVNTVNVADDIYLGRGVGSTGTMTVNGASDLIYDGMLYLGFGEGATGTLNINLSKAGSAVDMAAILGYDVNSVGTLNILDVNYQDLNLSSNADGDFIVGNGENSTGTLNITDVKEINVSRDFYLAKGPNSVATMTITDPDLTDANTPHINVGRNMYVGFGDYSDPDVDISGGMVVDVTNDFHLASGVDSTASLSVHDPNSQLNVGGGLYAADGNGAQATVSIYTDGFVGVVGDAHFGSGDGRIYQVGAGSNYIDYDQDPATVSLAVIDANMNVGGGLYIADGNGADATVTILGGGAVDVSGDASIGGDVDIYTSRDYTPCPEGYTDEIGYDDSFVSVTITGSGSRLAVGGNLYIAKGNGYYDDGLYEYDLGSDVGVDILGGGAVDVVGDAFIGSGNGSDGYVDVWDSSSRFSWGSMLYLGSGIDSSGWLDTHYSDANSAVDVNAIVASGKGSFGGLYIEDVNYQDLNLNSGAGFSLADGNDSEAEMTIHNVRGINVDGDLVLAGGVGSEAWLGITNDNYDDANVPHIETDNLYLGLGDYSQAGYLSWDGICGLQPSYYEGLGDGAGILVVNVANNAYLGFGYESHGVLELDNPDSQLNYGDTLYLGYGGHGALIINYGNLGSDKVMDVNLAYGEDSSGYLDILDANYMDFTLRSDPTTGNLVLGNGEDSRALIDITDVNQFKVTGDLIMARGVGSRAMITFNDSNDCYLNTEAADVIVGGNAYLGFGEDSQVGCVVGEWYFCDFCDVPLPVFGGPLDIHDHMTLDVGGDLSLGHGEGSVGYMTVDYYSRLTYGGMLYVGNNGYGQLDIDFGWLGSPKDMNVILGNGEDSYGYLYIEDANWQDLTFSSNSDGDFILGNGEDSMGFLEIYDANSITVGRDLIFANGSGSWAMMWIYDSNTYNTQATRLNVGRSLYLGRGDDSYAGCGYICSSPWWYYGDPLLIHDGMVLDVNEDIYLGFGVDSLGVMSVDSTSELIYGGTLYVGHGGTGLLEINYGNARDPNNLKAYVGYGEDSSGRLIIEDANTLNLSSNDNGDFFVAYGDDSLGLLRIEDVNNVNVAGTLYAAYVHESSVVGCDDYYDPECHFKSPGLEILDFNTINIGGDLNLAHGDLTQAWMVIDSDFNSPSMGVGGTMYLGYGEDSQAGLYIEDGITVNVNGDVYVDYGPECALCEKVSDDCCEDWSCCDASQIRVDPNSTLNVGGDLWLGYGNNSRGGIKLGQEDMGDAVLDVKGDIILGFQPDSWGKLAAYDSELSFGGQMFVGYGGHGWLEIDEMDRLDLDEGVVFFAYGEGSDANVLFDDVIQINVAGDLNLAYGQDSCVLIGLEEVNDLSVTGALNLAYGQDSHGEMSLAYVNDVDIAGNLNLAYGIGSEVNTVCISYVNMMNVGGNLNLGYGVGSSFGTLSVLDSTVSVDGGSLNMGYGGTADELKITRSFVGVGTDPYALDDGLSIGSNGTLTGSGRIWAKEVYNDGEIAPGSSTIDTLTIVGNLTFGTNSVYEVEVDNSNKSDLIEVLGDVNILGGTVRIEPTQTLIGSKQYTIIEADDVNVTSEFEIDDTALLQMMAIEPNAALGYGVDSVLLTIMAMQFDDPNIVCTDNQKALGSALQQIADGGGNSITTAVQSLENINQVRRAYSQLSGQTRPPLSPITIASTTRFMGTVSDRLRNPRLSLSYGFNRGPLLAMAGPDSSIGSTTIYDIALYNRTFALGNDTSYFADEKWGIWGKGYGLYGDRDSEGGGACKVPGYQYTVYGMSFGFDYQFTEKLRLGITGGYSDGDVDYDSLRDTSEFDGTHIGLYGSYDVDSWYFDSALTYAHLDYDMERHVEFDQIDDKLEGDFGGYDISGYFEAGYNWRDYKGYLIQPLASFQLSYLRMDSYTESGGSSRLHYDDQKYESYKGSLGMKVTKQLTDADGHNSVVELRGRWVHEFGDTKSSVDAHFAADPTAVVFKVSDEDISRESAVLGVGFSAKLSSRTQLFVDYDISLNADDTAHIFGAGLQYRW